jgi:hypothetical protein
VAPSQAELLAPPHGLVHETLLEEQNTMCASADVFTSAFDFLGSHTFLEELISAF